MLGRESLEALWGIQNQSIHYTVAPIAGHGAQQHSVAALPLQLGLARWHSFMIFLLELGK